MIIIVLGSIIVLDLSRIFKKKQLNYLFFSRNHRYFLFFVFFVWLYIISLFVTAGYYIKNNDIINKFMLNLNIDKNILFIVKIAISGFEIIIGLTFWVPLT